MAAGAAMSGASKESAPLWTTAGRSLLGLRSGDQPEMQVPNWAPAVLAQTPAQQSAVVSQTTPSGRQGGPQTLLSVRQLP